VEKGETPEGVTLREGRALELLSTVALKLTCGHLFEPGNKEHALAVMSQRVCLDLVLSSTKAIALADRSVSHHLRILTRYAESGPTFCTVSPSEPMLALAAFKLMHERAPNHDLNSRTTNLPSLLQTVSKDLCSAGLIEKGQVGELCARVLFTVARDLTVLNQGRDWEEAGKPVRVLDVLETLLGDGWAEINTRKHFEEAFGNEYVNYTHWIMTEDALPEEPDV
jgi:hypothetical protein